MTLSNPGKATVLFGGQWGSEGKGAIAAWLGLNEKFDIATTNAGAQAGHTSIHDGVTKVAFHLPTIALYQDCPAYLNAGSVIDVEALQAEMEATGFPWNRLAIHPRAAIITDDCKRAEREVSASTTKIASTQKGVGEAFARKVRRSGVLAKDVKALEPYLDIIDLNYRMDQHGYKVAVEVPQGFSLSLNASPFYPYCTSRDCGVAQGLSDAGIHPSFLGHTIMVIRTFPIRVGSIVEGDKVLGTSGGWYRDQTETSWEALGQAAERTTVTKRIRRVFTFSMEQVRDAIRANRPTVIAITFTNYWGEREQEEYKALKEGIQAVYDTEGIPSPAFIREWGPTTADLAADED